MPAYEAGTAGALSPPPSALKDEKPAIRHTSSVHLAGQPYSSQSPPPPPTPPKLQASASSSADLEKHPHPKALPELPCAVTLAAVLNDVAYFRSTFALIAAKQQRSGVTPAVHGPGHLPHGPAAAHAFPASAHGAARPPVHSLPVSSGPRIRQLSCGDVDSLAPCAPQPLRSTQSDVCGGGGGAGLAPIRIPAAEAAVVAAPAAASGGGDPASAGEAHPPVAAAAALSACCAAVVGHLEPPPAAHLPPHPVNAALLAVTGGPLHGAAVGGVAATPAVIPGEPASPVPLVTGAGTPLTVATVVGSSGHCGPAAAAGGLSVRSLATFIDRRVHDDEVLQVRASSRGGGVFSTGAWCCAHLPPPTHTLGCTDRCVRGVSGRRRGIPHGRCVERAAAVAPICMPHTTLFGADPSLLGLLRPSTGNSLLHYAVLGPPHVAEVYKAIRAHLLHNPELLQARRG